MASGARAAGAADTGRTGARADERTPAQWYCLLGGASLLLAGLIGMLYDSTFDTSKTDLQGGGALQGDKLLGIFEVNGIHNLIHIATGLLLLAVAPKRATAKTGVLAFGVVYGLVTVIGLIDGETVLGLIPVNAADNVLHIALTVAALLAAFASRADDDARSRTV